MTRFAPAPTGYLHLGHVANAIFVWGLARATGGRVLLRIEDHDRQRSRPAYAQALIDDLAWLGLVPEEGPVRQSDEETPYVDALASLRAAGLVYACDCARSTFARWTADHGRPWSGPGCPGNCRARRLEEVPGGAIRIAVGDGAEGWDDLAIGRRSGPVAAGGDPPARDRHGHWAYGFAVVVDDARQGVALVIRGADLVAATPDQIRLGRLLGRSRPPAFLHHPLILRPGGAKLSKAERDTSVRDLRAVGWSAERVLGAAAAAVGLRDAVIDLAIPDLAGVFAT